MAGNQNAAGFKHTEESKIKWSAVKKGRNNPSYDHTVYRFEHKEGGTFTRTQYDFREEYSLNSGQLSQVIQGNYKTINGWRLVVVDTIPLTC